MLNVIREKSHWFKWILFVVAITFVIFFGPGSLDSCGRRNAQGDTSWVARVDGKEIDLGLWQTTNMQLEQRYRQQFGQMWEQFRRNVNIRAQSAEQLIQLALVRKDAARLGLAVSDAELSGLITSLPMFQENGTFVGADRYRDALRRGSVPGFRSPESFEAMLRDELLVQKWSDIVGAAVTVTPAEIEQEFRRRHEKATFEYVALPVQPAVNVNPSDAELEAWYRANIDRFGSGEGRQLVVVQFTDDKLVEAKAQVSDAEIQGYYEANQAQFSRPEMRRARHILVKVEPDAAPAAIDAARAKAEALAKQAKAGADFAKLAEQNSDDPGSKASGGDLGAFPRGQMVPEFDEAVFSMQLGQVTDPVRTSFGFHVIKLEEIQSGGQMPLAQVKEQIRASLRFPKLAAAQQQLAKEFREKVGKAGDMERAAKEMKLPFINAGTVLRNDMIPQMGPAPDLMDAAFELEKGGVSDVLNLQRGAAVVGVTDIVKDFTPPLSARRDRVLLAWRQERGKEEAKARLEAALASAGGDLAKAAKALSLEVRKTDQPYIRRGGLPGVGSDPALDQAAFATAPGSTSPVVATPQAAVVVRVLGKEAAPMANLPREEARIRAELRAPLVDRLVSEKLKTLREQADVELNTDLLKNEA